MTGRIDILMKNAKKNSVNSLRYLASFSTPKLQYWRGQRWKVFRWFRSKLFSLMTHWNIIGYIRSFQCYRLIFRDKIYLSNKPLTGKNAAWNQHSTPRYLTALNGDTILSYIWDRWNQSIQVKIPDNFLNALKLFEVVGLMSQNYCDLYDGLEFY